MAFELAHGVRAGDKRTEISCSRDGRRRHTVVRVLLADRQEDVPRGRARNRVHQPVADALDLGNGVGAILEVAVDLLAARASMVGTYLAST